MEEAVFKAIRRDVIGKQVKALRREGQLPAVMYGKTIEPTPILLDLRESTRLLSRLAASALVTIELEGAQHKALVREKQRDFIRGTLKHIDFQVISMKEKLRVKVAIRLTGESAAVKDFNGVLVTGLGEVEVECLPQDLPQQITVDIAALKQIGDALYIRDLNVPDKVEILDGQDELVAVVNYQAAEEVVTPAEGVEGPEPEVIEKGKKEEAEE
jgi:large subunit ribosomal protein L25